MSTTTEAPAGLAAALGWGHERVELLHDRDSGLRAVVAIHSTALGPSLGGLRLRAYAGGMAEALDDALRLSRAMTLKASAAGLDLGGGKAVVLDDGRPELRRARLTALGWAIDALGGAYITAEDVGTTTADMELISSCTPYVVGRPSRPGRVAGDPSPATAATVFGAIGAALEALAEAGGVAAGAAGMVRPGAGTAAGSPRPGGAGGLDGLRVGVLGLGKVGGDLARRLLEAGATVVGCDPDPAAWEALRVAGGRLVADAEALLEEPLDVLAPCAFGGLIDDALARALRCRIVCGAANNPLTGPSAARTLADRGVLAVPDFLANCGGLVQADAERRGETDPAAVEQRLAVAAERTRETLLAALAAGRPPQEVAEERALARVAAAA